VMTAPMPKRGYGERKKHKQDHGQNSNGFHVHVFSIVMHLDAKYILADLHSFCIFRYGFPRRALSEEVMNCLDESVTVTAGNIPAPAPWATCTGLSSRWCSCC
jgi:hypothetical protein